MLLHNELKDDFTTFLGELHLQVAYIYVKFSLSESSIRSSLENDLVNFSLPAHMKFFWI